MQKLSVEVFTVLKATDSSSFLNFNTINVSYIVIIEIFCLVNDKIGKNYQATSY
jgi:hypothetical protein